MKHESLLFNYLALALSGYLALAGWGVSAAAEKSNTGAENASGKTAETLSKTRESQSKAAGIKGAATEKLSKLLKPQSKQVQPTHIRDKWALIVGLGSFGDNSIRPVKFAQEDALLLSSYCASQETGHFGPGHVVIVTNNKATKSNVEAALGDTWLLKSALPNDLIVLYFATRAQLSKDGTDMLLYLFDAPSSKPELGSIELKSMLKTLKQRTQSKHILCLLDLNPASARVAEEADGDAAARQNSDESQSPGSKQAQGSHAIDSHLLKEIAQETGTTILSAASPGERSYADYTNRCSYFIENLLEALSNTNGQDSFETVARYAIDKTREKVFQDLKRHQQPLLFTGEPESIMKAVIGMQVKSSTPEKPIRIGHPIEKMGMNREQPQPSASRAKAAIKPAAAATEDEEASYGDASFGNVDFGPYMAKMKRDIQAKWTPPKSANTQRVVAVFSIKKDGTITNAQIVDGSGVEAVDQSAMEALNKASPLDPLPDGSPPYVQIRYQFDWAVKKN